VIESKLVNDQAIVARALLSKDSDRTVVKVLNPSYEPVKLNRFNCLGIAESVDLKFKISVCMPDERNCREYFRQR
jgi:hypothetical protein